MGYELMGYEYDDQGGVVWVDDSPPPNVLPPVGGDPFYDPSIPVTGNIPGITPGVPLTPVVNPVTTKPPTVVKPVGNGRIVGHNYSADGVDLGASQTQVVLGYDSDTLEPYYIMYFPEAPEGYKYYDPNTGDYREYEYFMPALQNLSSTQTKKKTGITGIISNILNPGGGSSKTSTGGSSDAYALEQLKAQVANLNAVIQGMMGDRSGAGFPAKSERLVLNHQKAESMVEAALRRGLNQGYYDVEDLKRPDDGVVAWITEQTGLEVCEVKNFLDGLLGAGASALTMMLSGGNFPLGAMAYFAGQGATQVALNRTSDNPSPSQKALFQGIGGEAQLDGYDVTSLDVSLPAGLPHEIFGGYRFVCYDRIQKAWMPSDTVYPVQYWSDEPYRYLCLDRVKQRVLHADSIIKPKIYI